MEEIINFEWCEKHNMSLARVNVSRDKSFYLEKDGYCCVVYTESSTGEKTIHVFNPLNKNANLKKSFIQDLNSSSVSLLFCKLYIICAISEHPC